MQGYIWGYLKAVESTEYCFVLLSAWKWYLSIEKLFENLEGVYQRSFVDWFFEWGKGCSGNTEMIDWLIDCSVLSFIFYKIVQWTNFK